MAWHTYVIEPVDFGWDRLQTITDCAVAIGKDEGANFLSDVDIFGYGLGGFRIAVESAMDAARKAGYDGEPRNPPAVFWLPVQDSFEPGFVIKQDNNGTTFIVSPVPLPHLER